MGLLSTLEQSACAVVYLLLHDGQFCLIESLLPPSWARAISGFVTGKVDVTRTAPRLPESIAVFYGHPMKPLFSESSSVLRAASSFANSSAAECTPRPSSSSSPTAATSRFVDFWSDSKESDFASLSAVGVFYFVNALLNELNRLRLCNFRNFRMSDRGGVDDFEERGGAYYYHCGGGASSGIHHRHRHLFENKGDTDEKTALLRTSLFEPSRRGLTSSITATTTTTMMHTTTTTAGGNLSRDGAVGGAGGGGGGAGHDITSPSPLLRIQLIDLKYETSGTHNVEPTALLLKSDDLVVIEYRKILVPIMKELTMPPPTNKGTTEEQPPATGTSATVEAPPSHMRWVNETVVASRVMSFFYPIYWYDAPAPLKSFIDHLFTSTYFGPIPSTQISRKVFSWLTWLLQSRAGSAVRYVKAGRLRDKTGLSFSTCGGDDPTIFNRPLTSVELAMAYVGVNVEAPLVLANVLEPSFGSSKDRLLDQWRHKIQHRAKIALLPIYEAHAKRYVELHEMAVTLRLETASRIQISARRLLSWIKPFCLMFLTILTALYFRVSPSNSHNRGNNSPAWIPRTINNGRYDVPTNEVIMNTPNRTPSPVTAAAVHKDSSTASETDTVQSTTTSSSEPAERPAEVVSKEKNINASEAASLGNVTAS